MIQMFRDTHYGKPCQYCSRPMNRADYRLHATRDHANPRSKGGGITVVACITCNGIKGDMKPAEWRAFMVAHPSWWLLTKKELRDIRRKALGLPTVRKAYRVRVARRAVVVPPELIYGASQPATERTEP